MASYCATSDIIAIMPDSGLAGTIDEQYSTALDALITAASRLIDREVGRWDNYFSPSTDAETRYFDGSGEAEIEIDEMVGISGVWVSETGGTSAGDYTEWTENEDFFAYPYNRFGNTKPIRKLLINPDGDKPGWRRGRRTVKITGIFGYSENPPEDIKQACRVQVMRWYMRAQNAQQDSGANPALGEMTYVQELDPDVKTILYFYQLENMT